MVKYLLKKSYQLKDLKEIEFQELEIQLAEKHIKEFKAQTEQKNEVIESNNSDFQIGDYVVGSLGIQTYAISNGVGIEKVDTNFAPPEYWLGGMGIPGLTAYYALLDVCKPTVDKNVLITGAAGAVGSIAGQIAKICGSKVFGTTGSQEKCDWLVNELGYDYAFNYNDKDWFSKLKDASEGKLDIIFDNSGGEVMNQS